MICSFLLRHSIDLVIFCGKNLDEISKEFADVINEINEPNLPRVSLTPDRGKWSTGKMPVPVCTSGMSTPSGNQDSETQSLLQSNSSTTGTTFSGNHYIYAFNESAMKIDNSGDSIRIQAIESRSDRTLVLSPLLSQKPEILTCAKLAKGYTDSGNIKIRNDLDFSIVQKFESNPENLRSNLIPTIWDAQQRISSQKPEVVEIQLR